MSATILVADDETHILHVLSIKLQNAGFTVVAAHDGLQAYALACRSGANRPDLIISDFQMPGLSGLELACKLDRDPMTCDIPMILLTARGFDLPGRHQRSGADGKGGGCGPGNIRCVLAKPFSPRQILAKVNELLVTACAGG